MKGDRKLKSAREHALILLLGFIVAVWLKADVTIFGYFVGGLVGKQIAFMWGNAQEHKYATPNPPAVEAPKPA
jgi:hypothetical protein